MNRAKEYAMDDALRRMRMDEQASFRTADQLCWLCKWVFRLTVTVLALQGLGAL